MANVEQKPPQSGGSVFIPLMIAPPFTVVLPRVVSAAGGSMLAKIILVTMPMRRVAPAHSSPPSVTVPVTSRW